LICFLLSMIALPIANSSKTSDTIYIYPDSCLPTIMLVTMVGSGVSGTYTANCSVTAFITSNFTISGHYCSTGVLLPGADWSNVGSSGSYDVDFTNESADYYLLIFGNIGNSNYAMVDYTVNFKQGDIPGFEIIFVFFTMLAFLGLINIKKRPIP
jgi:hypothetical protein